tara:strand:+ start:124 stop:243 length:120 start_codon:yes stop_codon:yes gene_type:complete
MGTEEVMMEIEGCLNMTTRYMKIFTAETPMTGLMAIDSV